MPQTVYLKSITVVLPELVLPWIQISLLNTGLFKGKAIEVEDGVKPFVKTTSGLTGVSPSLLPNNVKETKGHRVLLTTKFALIPARVKSTV